MSYLADHVNDFVDTLFEDAEDPGMIADLLRAAADRYDPQDTPTAPMVNANGDVAYDKLLISVPASVLVSLDVLAGTEPDDETVARAVLDEHGKSVVIDTDGLGYDNFSVLESERFYKRGGN